MSWFGKQGGEFKDKVIELAQSRVHKIKKSDAIRAEVHRKGRKRAREELEKKEAKKRKREDDE